MIDDSEMVSIMDKAGEKIRIRGSYKRESLTLDLSKVKRKRKSWTVEGNEECQRIGLIELPSKDKDLIVHGFYTLDDVCLSSKEEELEKEEAPLLEEKDVEKLFRDKLGPTEINCKDFWLRQGLSPTLPDLNAGSWIASLKKAKKKTDSCLSEMVLLGFAKRTRQKHQVHLKDLENSKPPKETSLVKWLLKLFEERYKEREWEGSTLCAAMASMQGALASLPLYREGMAPVLLKISPEWRMGMKGAANMGRGKAGSSKYRPKIATLADVKKAISLEKSPVVRAAVELGWVTAARGGCITELRTGNILANGEGTTVRFMHGKIAHHRPYTIHTTQISKSSREYVERRLLEAKEGSWLFPGLTGEKIKLCLRRANPRLEQRSLRRGAIQHLAAGDMKDEDLLHISQHRTLDTLNRYLEFGWLSGEGKERMRRAKGLSLKSGESDSEEEEEED